MKMNGSQILIQALIDQGVDTIFGYPGGSMTHYMKEVRISVISLAAMNKELHMQQMDMLDQQGKPGYVLRHQDREQRIW